MDTNFLFYKTQSNSGSMAIYSSGIVRSLPSFEHKALARGDANEDLVIDLVGRPIHVGLRVGDRIRRLGSGQDVRVLGALALSDRPLCPDELPTSVAQPSKLVERLRRRLDERWIATHGRGEAKSYEFTIPDGKSVVVIVDSSLGVDVNGLSWFGST